MSQVIYEIKKNNSEIIRVDVSEFKGKDLINIRIWYQAQDYNTGDVIYKPTQKGITLDINKFSELKTAIDKLDHYISDLHKGTVPDQPEDQLLEKEEETDEEKKEQE